MDETWIKYDSPHTRQSAGEWLPADSPAPELPRLPNDRRKAMAIVFWDAEGLVHLDWFISTKNQRGLNGELYAAILDRFVESLRCKRAAKMERGVLLLQDNAPIHKRLLVREKLAQLGIQELDHPPYSPDLAPSDCFLFRVLKQDLRGGRSDDQATLDRKVRAWFEGKPAAFYAGGIDALKERSERVVEAQGAYLRD